VHILPENFRSELCYRIGHATQRAEPSWTRFGNRPFSSRCRTDSWLRGMMCFSSFQRVKPSSGRALGSGFAPLLGAVWVFAMCKTSRLIEHG
jgi:hypothetical protein